jgi:glycosyltransferase involved in cell wall biosynthesis
MTPPIHARSIEQLSPRDPMVARALVGLADRPTIVAIGPFNDRTHAEQLADAFITVRLRCKAQLVLLGTGAQRATVLRRAFAQSAGTSVHLVRDSSAHRWSDLIAAADVVMPGITTGFTRLLDVLAAGRPMVAPANPATVRLIVPSSAGLVYRPGAVSAMADALLRILTTPELHYGMATRAREVARRHHLEHITSKQSDEGNGDG